MIDPKKITPLLNSMTVNREIGRGPNGTVYQVTRRLDEKVMAVKHISIPARSSQTQALIYAGAVANEGEAQKYYSSLVQDIKEQLLSLNGISTAPNLLKFRGYQVDQKFLGAGYDVYLLSDFRHSLPEFLSDKPITKLEAVNLAIDLCSALEQLRSADLIHSDVRPTNIFAGDSQRFMLGDLGLVKKSELPYSSMPDESITEYTAPEVIPPDAPLSDTMDIYSVGMILYEIFNGLQLPPAEGARFQRQPGELPAPAYADEAMQDMILKACAYDPAQRYQTPSEMKEALVLYMQRAKPKNEPLLPTPEPEEEPAAEPAAEAVEASPEEAHVAEPVAETGEEPDLTAAAVAGAAAGGAAGGAAAAAAEAASDEPAPSTEDTAPAESVSRAATTVEQEVDAIESAINNPNPEASMDTTVLGPGGLSDTETFDESAAPDAGDEDTTKVIPVLSADAAMKQAELEETRRFSLNDLKEDDLLMPSEGDISVEEFLASIRTTPGLEVLSMDDSGKTTAMPGYENEATLPEDTEYLDSADARDLLEDPGYEPLPPEDMSYPADAPVDAVPDIVPDFVPAPAAPADDRYEAGEETAPAEVPDEEPEVLSKKAAKKAEKARLKAEKKAAKQAESAEAKAGSRRKKYSDDYDEFDDYDDGYEDDLDEEDSSKTWKRALAAIIVLLILAGGTFAAYTLKTDTVTDMKSEVLSSTSVQVSAESRNGSGMEVVCATAAGEVNREPLRNGTATFTGLEPSTAYSFTLESTEGKLLLGGKLAQAQTKQMTSLTAFQTSALSATTADLVIRGTGDQPESWVVTCTADNGDVITASGNDATKPIHVEGLTPETKYTATIARSDGDALGGTTTCEFTTQYYTVLGEFEASEITPDSATVRWLYSGTVPDAWTVTCEGSDGTSTTQDVSGTECTVDGLTGGVTYNFTLSCPSLQATDLSSISVNIPSVTITEIAAVENEDGDIEVTWEYESKDAPAQWNISYVYNAENEATPSLATSDSNSVTLTDLIPNCEYTIVVESADDFPVGGSTEITCLTSEADPFTDYGCTDTSMTLYAVESGVDEDVTTFTTDQHIGFKIQATYDVTDEDKNVKTLYLIRNADGLPVYVYRNDDPGRSWSGSWVTARHTGDLPDMPQTPGTYTLEVYFDGGFMASAEFTVEAGLGTPPEETAEEGGEEGAEEAAEEGGEDGAEEAAEEGGEEGAEESGGIAAP